MDQRITLTPLDSIIIKDRQREHVPTDAEIDELAESIRTIGLINPVIIDDSNTLIAGECRIKAHRRLGRTHIPTINRADLTDWEKQVMELEENIRRFALDYRDRLKVELKLHRMYVEKHGKVVTLSGRGGDNAWKIADTAALLGVATSTASQRLELAQALEKDPKLADGKTETQAFNEFKRQKELRTRQMLAVLTAANRPVAHAAQSATPSQATPASPAAAETEETLSAGVSTLESFTHELAILYKGSCLDIIPTLTDNSISCLVTDPPWQVKFDTQFGTDPKAGLKLTADMLKLLKPKLQDGALCWLFCASMHLFDGTIYNLIKDCGYEPTRHAIIWCKPKLATCSWPYREIKPDYEPCLLFSKGKARDFTAPIFALQEAKVPHGEKVHPAQKPVEVLTTIIQTSTVPGELVIDPFAGSAVTLKTCNELRRHSIGCELSDDWYATGVLKLTETNNGLREVVSNK